MSRTIVFRGLRLRFVLEKESIASLRFFGGGLSRFLKCVSLEGHKKLGEVTFVCGYQRLIREKVNRYSTNIFTTLRRSPFTRFPNPCIAKSSDGRQLVPLQATT